MLLVKQCTETVPPFDNSARLLQRCAILYQRISACHLQCHSRQTDTEILYGPEEAAHHGPFAQSTCYLIEQNYCQ